MAFHCDKCGSTLEGDYQECPVCSLADEAAGKYREAYGSGRELSSEEKDRITDAAREGILNAEKGGKQLSAEEILEAAGLPLPSGDSGSGGKPKSVTEVLEIAGIRKAQKQAEDQGSTPSEPADDDSIGAILDSVRGRKSSGQPEENADVEEPASEEAPAEEESGQPGEEKTETPENPGESEESAEQAGASEPADEETGEDAREPDEDEEELGLIEKQLISQQMGVRGGKGSRGSFIWSAVIVLMVVALGICTALFVVKPLIEKKNMESESAAYMNQLVGAWLSNDFTFADDPETCLRELLVINEDGTFTMDYLTPTEDDENGWQDGTWESSYSITGTVKVSAENQRLILLYEENGESYYYDRYLISLSDTQMGLREYYSEDRMSYYDLDFTLVADDSSTIEPHPEAAVTTESSETSSSVSEDTQSSSDTSAESSGSGS
ncbi:MAG: hypothetical protein ACOX6J_05485 [Oscillospiraceae bacterium]|jgi:hypothetical protein